MVQVAIFAPLATTRPSPILQTAWEILSVRRSRHREEAPRSGQRSRAGFERKIFLFREAAGLYRQEIRHSNVLAFLLRPQEKHGLGDAFLKKIIQKALENSSGASPVSALTVALSDFSDALVRREWRNIDLVVESPSNKLIVAIENKIESSEGGGQLSKYESSVCSEFPNSARLYCYLTEDGDPASNELWSPTPGGVDFAGVRFCPSVRGLD
jgi:hypothetical protein